MQKKEGEEMTLKEREEDPGNSFDGGYHLYAREKYKERVAKTPARVQYAIEQFEKNDIEYRLLDSSIGHFHCRRKSDDKLFQFWAGTGKIMGEEHIRGIHLLVKKLIG